MHRTIHENQVIKKGDLFKTGVAPKNNFNLIYAKRDARRSALTAAVAAANAKPDIEVGAAALVESVLTRIS